MMKRGIRYMALLLAFLLALAAPALAADLVAGPSPVYLEDGVAVRASQGVSSYAAQADLLVYADEDLLICEKDGELIAYRADGSTRELGALTCDAVWCEADRRVYFVGASAPATLMKLSVLSLTASAACDAEADIQQLRLSADGVLAQADGEEYLYVPAQRKLVWQDESAAYDKLIVRDGYEARLDGEGLLTLREKGAAEPTEVSPGALCAALGDGVLCYLQAWGENARLMVYDIDTGDTRRLYRFDEPMYGQIAVLGTDAYVLSQAGKFYRCDMTSGEPVLEAQWKRPAFAPRFAGVDGLLAVYDMASGEPALLWASEEAEPFPTPSPTPVPTPTPNPYPTLSRGARGDAVKRLQEKLRELGYLSGSADGVYGTSTQVAVTYLQYDMGLSQTGTADAAFQREVLQGDPPTFSTYVTLSRGDSGIRVRDLQGRLREMYFTKEPADGYYGSDTAAAVERFQAQKGYKERGSTITVSQQRALFKSGARTCTRYYTLERGDEAPVVLHLNKRLKKLGYLSSGATESYNRHTEKAVKAFQMLAGIKESGVADPRTQRLLYESGAPTPTPTPEPTPMPEDKQAVKSSVIKTMRTWMKNNLGGDFSKEDAVTALQGQLMSLGYMATSEINSVYNETTVNAVKEFQRDYGLKVNGNANKQTLKALFF